MRLGKIDKDSCTAFFLTATRMEERHTGGKNCPYAKGVLENTLSRVTLREALKGKDVHWVHGWNCLGTARRYKIISCWQFHVSNCHLRIGCHSFTGAMRAKILRWARGR